MSPQPVPDCFCRVSVKALILDAFLITKETKGHWELLGGGLDWGVSPQDDMARELKEEAGLTVTSVAEQPSYFFVKHSSGDPYWYVNVVYETTVADLAITPSEECIEVAFVNQATMGTRRGCPAVQQLLKQFDPKRHQ
jgi:8-oxo-dGTP pyrophosphatase MutT (NUDIX family)